MPRYEFRTNEQEVAEARQKVKVRPNPVLRAAAVAAMTEDEADMACKGQSFVNYAAAPVGGQTYDANWLATNTAVR